MWAPRAGIRLAALCVALLLAELGPPSPATAAARGAATAADQLPVVVVAGLELDDLRKLDGAAVGLLVPGAGPSVSGATALASLERGAVRNSLRGGLPGGDRMIAVEADGSLPETGPAIILALPQGGEQPNDRRYPIAVIAPGYSGLLTSDSTRIDGLVSIADVAPTALGSAAALSSRPSADPVSELQALDERIRDNARARPLAALLAGALVLLLALASWRAALLGVAAALGANAILGALGISEPWIVLLVIGLSVAVGAPVAALVLRSPLAVGCALAVAIGGYLLALGLDGESIALSPLGPTQNSRFYGLSNLLAALLLVPSLAAAALLRVALGWRAALLVAAAVLVLVAGARFGADGGGAIVLVAAYALLAVELAGARRRAVAGAVALGILAVTALVVFDAVTGASSHVTRALGGGPSGLASEIGDRAVLSYERATEHWYTALVVALGAALLAALAVRLLRTGLPRSRRALPLAVALGTAISLVVNDSPLEVIAVGLVSYLAVLGYATSGAAAATRRANAFTSLTRSRAPNSSS